MTPAERAAWWAWLERMRARVDAIWRRHSARPGPLSSGPRPEDWGRPVTEHFARGMAERLDVGAALGLKEDELSPDLRARVKEARVDVRQAMAELREVLANADAAAARLERLLASDTLARGLASERPEVRTEAERVRDAMVAQWERLTGKTWPEGGS